MTYRATTQVHRKKKNLVVYNQSFEMDSSQQFIPSASFPARSKRIGAAVGKVDEDSVRIRFQRVQPLHYNGLRTGGAARG